MTETTTKKASFLQQYPLVPAVFFILFAWAILHLVTPYKPALRDIQTMDDSPTLWQSDDSLAIDWQLKITEQHIHFQATPQDVWQTYHYQKVLQPIVTFEGASTTRKSHIKVFILPEKKGKKQEILIVQEDKCFYGLVKIIKQNKNK